MMRELLLLLRRSRWMMRHWEMMMMMVMVITMKSGLSKNLEGDRTRLWNSKVPRRAAIGSERKVSAAALALRCSRSEMEERQRNFLAATAKRRAEEKQETERLQRLRAAGMLAWGG